jgi:two-component system cell cycle response regulator CpdR
VTKILLAEDDDSMRAFLAAALRRASHEVQDYADGETALAALEREVFDLLHHFMGIERAGAAAAG